MLARRVLITAGTPGHMYLEERQAKCLRREAEGETTGGTPCGKGHGIWVAGTEGGVQWCRASSGSGREEGVNSSRGGRRQQ